MISSEDSESMSAGKILFKLSMARWVCSASLFAADAEEDEDGEELGVSDCEADGVDAVGDGTGVGTNAWHRLFMPEKPDGQVATQEELSAVKKVPFMHTEQVLDDTHLLQSAKHELHLPPDPFSLY